jgi:hypothetical protein
VLRLLLLPPPPLLLLPPPLLPVVPRGLLALLPVVPRGFLALLPPAAPHTPSTEPVTAAAVPSRTAGCQDVPPICLACSFIYGFKNAALGLSFPLPRFGKIGAILEQIQQATGGSSAQPSFRQTFAMGCNA